MFWDENQMGEWRIEWMAWEMLNEMNVYSVSLQPWHILYVCVRILNIKMIYIHGDDMNVMVHISWMCIQTLERKRNKKKNEMKKKK